jgi:hypothetical protein
MTNTVTQHKNKRIFIKEKMFTATFQTLNYSFLPIFKNVLSHCLANIAAVMCNL